MEGTKTYSFRKMPVEVYKIIVAEQNRIKGLKGLTQYSLEQTIYSIIKEWKRCREESNFKP